MDHRAEKIESLMQTVLAELIAQDFQASRETIISVTKVKLSGNQQEAKVYISVLPDQKRELVVNALEKEVIFFQRTLNKKLRIRPVPKIIFIPDANPAQAQQVETLLEQLKKS
jgi:ribosome-binding factor A